MERLGEQKVSEDKYASKYIKDLQRNAAGEAEGKRYHYLEETKSKTEKPGRNQSLEEADFCGEEQKEGGKKAKYFKLKSFLFRKDNLILVILGGILCMIIAMPVGTKQETIGEGENTLGLGNTDAYVSGAKIGEKEQNTDYQSGIERRMEELLLQTEGCENVRVMITFEEGQSDVSGKYDYCFTYPKISGIIVCINDGNDPRTAEKVTAYIQALFSVEAHKIRVANIKTSAYGG